MREIKFKGKRIDNGDWVYGQWLPISKTICTEKLIEGTVQYRDIYVKERTVGQFTGLYDQNGKEVYEGDIVEGTMGKLLIFYGEIVGDGYGFQWEPLANSQWESFTGFIDEYEVIGNIHDNPELLEKENK